MGIPVIDVTATYSLASHHPVMAVMLIVAIVLVGIGLYRFSIKHPKSFGYLRLAFFAAYIGVASWSLWETFKPQPSPMQNITEFVQKLDEFNKQNQEK